MVKYSLNYKINMHESILMILNDWKINKWKGRGKSHIKIPNQLCSSVIYFSEFLCKVRSASRLFFLPSFLLLFFFLHVDVYLFQPHLLKKPSLLHLIALLLCQRSMDCTCVDLILGSLFYSKRKFLKWHFIMYWYTGGDVVVVR